MQALEKPEISWTWERFIDVACMNGMSKNKSAAQEPEVLRERMLVAEKWENSWVRMQ